jgi:hypothetical protein
MMDTDQTGAAGPQESEIRTLAYHLWEEAGCPQGDPDRYWHAAERELQGGAVPEEPADPHPSDEDHSNVHNPAPGGDRRV